MEAKDKKHKESFLQLQEEVYNNKETFEDDIDNIKKNFDVSNIMGVAKVKKKNRLEDENNGEPVIGITDFIELQKQLFQKGFKTMEENK